MMDDPLVGSDNDPSGGELDAPVKANEQRASLEQVTDNEKRFFTLRAQLALKGYGLHRTAADDGAADFRVTRWGLVRELTDVTAVRAFAEQVGATHA